jgi:hypothetical protein
MNQGLLGSKAYATSIAVTANSPNADSGVIALGLRLEARNRTPTRVRFGW